MKNVSFSLLFMLIVGLLFSACKKEDAVKSPLEAVRGNSNLTTFLAALERTNLTGTLVTTSALTVFAPTNAAFDAFLTAKGYTKLEDVPTADLKQILSYHLLPEAFKLGRTYPAQPATLATFGTTNSPLKLFIDQTTVHTLNTEVKVEKSNISTTTGFLNTVDKVVALPKVVDVLKNIKRFSTFLEALTRPDLSIDYASSLNEVGPFTLFIPENSAFTGFFYESNYADLNAIPANVLSEILQYHIAFNFNLTKSDLANMSEVTVLGGKKFSISMGSIVTDEQGRQGNIGTFDFQTSNGVVHALDRVLLPN